MNTPSEYSESGQPIYRHKPSNKGFEFAVGDSENIEAISAHIEAHLGTCSTVFHELISHLVHIDVHIIPPSEMRPFYSLVTSGMSDKPMTVPEGYESLRHAELMICLPPDWPMSKEEWDEDANYWPIRLLKSLARMPHEYDTWLGLDHTIPNGHPPEPLGNSGFCCAMIGAATTAPGEFWQLKISDEKTIVFYGVHLLYREEMDLKMKKGAEAVWQLLEKKGASELLDVNRKNVAKKWLGIF